MSEEHDGIDRCGHVHKSGLVCDGGHGHIWHQITVGGESDPHTVFWESNNGRLVTEKDADPSDRGIKWRPDCFADDPRQVMYAKKAGKLSLFTNCAETWIAENADDARLMYSEWDGCSIDDVGEWVDRKMLPGETLSMWSIDGQTKITKTVAEWISENGPGFLCLCDGVTQAKEKEDELSSDERKETVVVATGFEDVSYAPRVEPFVIRTRYSFDGPSGDRKFRVTAAHLEPEDADLEEKE